MRLNSYDLLKNLLRFIPPDDSCMEWPRSKNQHGYGQLGQVANESLVHRAAYEIAIGPIPKGLLVCHRCDNPPCFRPSHLFAGTQTDNMLDCALKQRARVTSNLTRENIAKIRSMIQAGVTQAEISRMFGLDQSTVSNIKTGKHWKWVQ